MSPCRSGGHVGSPAAEKLNVAHIEHAFGLVSLSIAGQEPHGVVAAADSYPAKQAADFGERLSQLASLMLRWCRRRRPPSGPAGASSAARSRARRRRGVRVGCSCSPTLPVVTARPRLTARASCRRQSTVASAPRPPSASSGRRIASSAARLANPLGGVCCEQLSLERGEPQRSAFPGRSNAIHIAAALDARPSLRSASVRVFRSRTKYASANCPFSA